MTVIGSGYPPALQAGGVFGTLQGGKGQQEDVVSTLPNNSSTGQENASSLTGQTQLTESEQYEVDKLQKRDAEVKAHERAHQAAGGQYTGGATFTYETGPDGQRYAVGGEVSVDAGAVSGNPSATVRKMRTVIAAAMAPADPSAQDRAVAQQARQTMVDAQAQLSQERMEKASGAMDGSGDNVENASPFTDASAKYQLANALGGVKSNDDTGFSVTA